MGEEDEMANAKLTSFVEQYPKANIIHLTIELNLIFHGAYNFFVILVSCWGVCLLQFFLNDVIISL